jgi:hypothetical protein
VGRVLHLAPAVLVPLVLATAGFAAESSSKARLKIVGTHPLELRGDGFVANEKVALRVSLGAKTYKRTLRASAGGRFTSRFESLVLDRCSKRLAVRAVGAKGDAAEFELQTLPCPNDMTR